MSRALGLSQQKRPTKANCESLYGASGGNASMPRPKKKARDLTTEEALAKLFPKKAITKAKEEAEKASKQATKEDPKP
jgi:hypothetical protein